MKESLDDIIKKRVIVAPSGENEDVIDPFADTDSPDKELLAFKRLKECASKIGDIDSKFDKFLEALHSLEKSLFSIIPNHVSLLTSIAKNLLFLDSSFKTQR